MWKAYGRQRGTETLASIVTAAAEAHQPRSAGSCVVLLQGCNAKFWPESQLSCHHHAVLFVRKFLHSIALWKSSVSLLVPLLQKREGRMQRQYFKSEFRNHAVRSFFFLIASLPGCADLMNPMSKDRKHKTFSISCILIEIL